MTSLGLKFLTYTMGRAVPTDGELVKSVEEEVGNCLVHENPLHKCQGDSDPCLKEWVGFRERLGRVVFKWRGKGEQRCGSRNVEGCEGTASRENGRNGEGMFVGWGVAGIPRERRAGVPAEGPQALCRHLLAWAALSQAGEGGTRDVL